MKLTKVLLIATISATALSIKQNIVKCTPPPHPQPQVHTVVHHEASYTVNGKGQSHVHRVVNGDVKKSGTENIRGGYTKKYEESGRKFRNRFFKRAKEDAANVGGGNSGGSPPIMPPVRPDSATFDIVAIGGKGNNKLYRDSGIKGTMTVNYKTRTVSFSGFCGTCLYSIRDGKIMPMCPRMMCTQGPSTVLGGYIGNVVRASKLEFIDWKALNFKVQNDEGWFRVRSQ